MSAAAAFWRSIFNCTVDIILPVYAIFVVAFSQNDRQLENGRTTLSIELAKNTTASTNATQTFWWISLELTKKSAVLLL